MKVSSCIVAAIMIVVAPPRASASTFTVNQALDFLDSRRVQPTPDQEMFKWLGRAGLSAGATVGSFYGWCAAFALISKRPLSASFARNIMTLSPLGVLAVAGLTFYFTTLVSVGMAAPRAAVIAIAPFEFKERLSFSRFLDLPRAEQLAALAGDSEGSEFIVSLAERLSRGERIEKNRMYDLLRSEGEIVPDPRR